jgi:hypothetical protein
MRARLFLVLVFLASAGFDGCGGVIIENNGFDLWCGDTLCSWTVEAGAIARVPTWHEQDYGVELIGPSVILSQIPTIDGLADDCLEISALVDVGPGAEVSFGIDLADDGTIDRSCVLAGSGWAVATCRLCLGGAQDNRFVITKTGDGVARLAQVRAEPQP